MTEREKMIEELAKDIHNAKRLSDYHCYEDEYTDCKKCKLLKYAENKMCQDAYEACFLIEEGYRKITEGAVVLTREEYERLKGLPEKVHNEMTERLKAEIAIEKRMGEDKLERFENNMKNVLEIEKENVRKETAKEIFDKLLNLCYNDNHPRGSIAAGEIRYIAKIEYGVEVEE